MTVSPPPSLLAGIYEAFVFIVAPNTANVPMVKVRLTVYDPPRFIAIPGKIDFTWQAGKPLPPAQTLYVTASGKAVAFSAETDPGTPWLQTTPRGTNTPSNVTLSAMPSNLKPGVYSGFVNLTTPNSEAPKLSVPVTLTVLAEAPVSGSGTP